MLEMFVEDAFRRFFQFSRKLVIKPDEILLDGIFLNPDGLDLEDECVEEYKATWRSSKKLDHFEDFFTEWIWQIMAYCHALGTQKARLLILFINGNYHFRGEGGGPQIKCLEFFFSKDELEDNWRMILTNAKVMRKNVGER